MDNDSTRKRYDNIWRTKWTDMQKYGPVHRHQRRIYRSLLRPLQNTQLESVLDVGCGTGDNLTFIKSIFPSIHVFGTDITDVPLKIAQDLIPEGKFWTDDIQNPQKTSGLFDLVTCFEVIEHIEDDRNALKNICKITNKYLLLSTPGGKMREVEREIGHFRNYKLKQLQETLESLGFRVVKAVQWGFPFYSPIFRTIAAKPQVVTFSYGRYNLQQKLACQLLYGLFFLNSWDKGDKIILLAEKVQQKTLSE
jgi:2-polyprenyl-3-methyl-5-hydroxy-6-metoxy-1,4-benzoquinol methylase